MTARENMEKPKRPTIPAAEKLLEFDFTLEKVQNAFIEMWALLEYLEIEGIAPLKYHLGVNQADIIALYLCGFVRGLTSDTEVLYSALAAWDVAKEYIPYVVKEA